jgi:hypothetical protein
MKWINSLLSLLIVLSACQEQQQQTPAKEPEKNDQMVIPPPQVPPGTYSNIDISPMDMSYFPVDYPKLKMTDNNIAPPVTRVIYSRPHLAKRRLFHDLLKYDEPWRLGANESTEIDFYKPVTIGGKKIAPGRYILYTIPHEGKWTIVLNSNIDSWGLQQDPKKDIHSMDVPVSSGNPSQEFFTMVYEKSDTGADLVISWDDIKARLPINF